MENPNQVLSSQPCEPESAPCNIQEEQEKAGQTQRKQPIIKKFPVKIIVGAAALVLLLVFVIILHTTNKEAPQPEIITVSSLEKIINVSELSTFTAVYNRIATVPNANKPEKIDYYVAYDAKVNAGIELTDISVSVDNETKTVTVEIPEIHITTINVDIGSLDFIFLNSKANTSTVTQAAFKACEEDVRQESAQQTAIYDLAKQNAINVLKALIEPIINQLDAEYTLSIR